MLNSSHDITHSYKIVFKMATQPDACQHVQLCLAIDNFLKQTHQLPVMLIIMFQSVCVGSTNSINQILGKQDECISNHKQAAILTD